MTYEFNICKTVLILKSELKVYDMEFLCFIEIG